MSDLIKMLEQNVYVRYTKSIEEINRQGRYVEPQSEWNRGLLINEHTREKMINWHKNEIDARITLGADPSEAPFLIRHYLNEGIDVLNGIVLDWRMQGFEGCNLGDLGQIGLVRMSLAYPSIKLGFYCAAKEIDPLQAYALEYKYRSDYHRHLMRSMAVAYKADLKQCASGELRYVDGENYCAAFRDIACLCADHMIKLLTQARDDLSGCSG